MIIPLHAKKKFASYSPIFMASLFIIYAIENQFILL